MLINSPESPSVITAAVGGVLLLCPGFCLSGDTQAVLPYCWRLLGVNAAWKETPAVTAQGQVKYSANFALLLCFYLHLTFRVSRGKTEKHRSRWFSFARLLRSWWEIWAKGSEDVYIKPKLCLCSGSILESTLIDTNCAAVLLSAQFSDRRPAWQQFWWTVAAVPGVTIETDHYHSPPAILCLIYSITLPSHEAANLLQ